MINKLSADSLKSKIHYDVIIIGTGPAGITVLNELSRVRPNAKICVLESGEEKPTQYSSDLKKVYSDKLKIKEHSRERVIGGTSTTWSGLSAPFEPLCLSKRPWLEFDIGWPISQIEIEKYYKKAAITYRFPTLENFKLDTTINSPWQKLRETGDFKPTWEKLDEKIFLQSIPVQRFNLEFATLLNKDSVDVFIDASAKKFLFKEDDEQKTITGVVVKSSHDEEFIFTAKRYILCSGGIENARVLLNSEESNGDSLGNQYDQVGRYMMNHPKRYQGVLSLNSPLSYLPYYFGCMWNGFSGYAGIKLTDEQQTQKELVSAYLRFEPIFPWTDNPGVDSFVSIIKSIQSIVTTWTKFKKNKVIELRSYAETGDSLEIDESGVSFVKKLSYVIFNFGSVIHYIWFRLFKRPVISQIRLCTFLEMEPDENNRIMLSDHLDKHGFRLPIVKYKPTACDQRSIEELTNAFIQEIKRQNIGDVTDPLSIDGEFYESINKYSGYDASHHMGGTRMGNDPANSVVNPYLQVHNVTNLFISGSSVFPTSDVANPTFMIVALSIRLAEHLDKTWAEC